VDTLLYSGVMLTVGTDPATLLVGKYVTDKFYLVCINMYTI